MVHDIMDRMTSELIGRDAELEHLSSTLGISASGSAAPDQHASVLLAGDAGVGKTRLLTELRDRVVDSGWQVLAGHCLDFADSALPYLPFSEITGRIARELPDLFDDVATRHPALLRLLPGQRMLSQATDPESIPADQAALLDGVHALAEAAGARQPLLLVVEDLHWADQSTRDLISFLFGRGFEAPVALIGSYRSDDLHRRHPLRRQVAVWARMTGVERVQLEPLDAADVRRLVERLHPDPLPEERVRDIVDPRRGQRVLRRGARRRLVGPHRRHPRGPRRRAAGPARAARRRGATSYARPPSPAAASPTPRSARVVDLPPADLDRAVRDAVEGHVLVPSRDDFYEFRHALLAEAVYDDLLPGERTSLHAAYAGRCTTAARTGTAPPSWPGTPAWPRTTPPRSPPASARATTPVASAAPRRPRSTTSRRSTSGTTRGCPDDTDLDLPRLVGPGRRRPDHGRPPGPGARWSPASSSTTCRRTPTTRSAASSSACSPGR